LLRDVLVRCPTIGPASLDGGKADLDNSSDFWNAGAVHPRELCEDDTLNVQFAAKSIQGRRDYNEDRILFRAENDCFIAAVADGMGGYSGGEVASQIVIDLCGRRFDAFASAPNPEGIEKMIHDIVGESREMIRRTVEEKAELKGMGTTLTIAAGCLGEYVVGNIGDSRTYLISGGSIDQLTKDNSIVQEYKDKLAEGQQVEEAILGNVSSALTRSLSGADCEADMYPGGNRRFTLREGDILLLCSDGLVIDKIGDVSSQLMKLTRSAESPAKAANALIDWAYVNGSSDNISVILAFEGEWAMTKKWTLRKLLRRSTRNGQS
jgi:serine/threonine protein phosphatase PrpC